MLPKASLGPSWEGGRLEAFCHRLAHRVAQAWREGRRSVRLRLWPPSLGELEVRLHCAERSLEVQLLAEDPQVASLLQQHLPALREALGRAGLQGQVRVSQREGARREAGGRHPSGAVRPAPSGGQVRSIIA